MGKHAQDRAADADAPVDVSRRSFLTRSAAGASAAAIAGLGVTDANAQTDPRWDLAADVVIIGAVSPGFPPPSRLAIMAPR